MNSSQNKSSSILGNCLGCGGLVRVPSSAAANSKVRCPHCTESFPLSQLLEQIAPEMEIVNEHEIADSIPHADRSVSREKANEVMPEREKFVVPAQLSKGSRRRKRHRRRDKSNEPGFDASNINGEEGQTSISRRGQGNSPDAEGSMRLGDHDTSSSKGSSAESRRHDSARNHSSSGSRSRKKRRESTMDSSSGIEVFKIAIGGVLAFPIAYLLVMWIFAQDPLGLGPTIGKFASFAVPPALRNAEDESEKAPVAEPEGESEDDDRSLPIPDVDPDKVRANEIG